MPTLSDFKNSVKTALKVPHNGYKPRPRRQVITFNEALENLKTSQTGFVICAAFHSFGRCRKEITLLDSSNFLANLDQFDLTDIQAPIKLMPLMLCSTHWGKTVYHNALFLDWLSVYGSKQDHPHFENTVVDYQSAIVIDNKESSLPNIAISPGSTPDNQGRPVSAPNSSTKDENYLNNLNRAAQVQINSDYEKPSPSEPEPDRAAQNLPEISVLVGMESYASIELGVATLEIMYQENLKCIAMTSDGWRCPAVIHKEQLLKARELLSSYATSGSKLDIELLPRLVLCPGHAIGDLPRMYSEKWAIFSEQRLSKEEAMSKFNADFWMSVQFFSNDKRDDVTFRTTSLNRPRSTSNLSSRRGEKYDFRSTEHARGNSPTPLAKTPLDSPTQSFEFSLSNRSLKPEVGTMLNCEDFLERASSSDHPAEYLRTKRQPESVAAPVFINVRPMDESPRPETIASSASKEVIKEAIPQEQNAVAQDSRPKTPTIPPSSQGAIQQANRIRSQDIIDKELIKEMNSPDLRGGYVYIFNSPHRKLCKIGKATDINVRKQQIQTGCQLQGFDQVNAVAIRTTFPERVTKLVHLELQNFRAKLSCEGHHHPEYNNEAVQSEHGEWFNVTEEVAIHSVNLWCDFTCRAYTPDGTIKEEWARRLTLLPKPDSTETCLLEKVLGGGYVPDVSSYHFERINRYNKWIREGSA